MIRLDGAHRRAVARVCGSSLLALSAAAAAACVSDLVGPNRSLMIGATRTELLVGEEEALSVSVGPMPLLPAEVDWLSRDPSTVTVRDGVARGVFPGATYVVAVRRQAIDSVEITVRVGDLSEGEAAVRWGPNLLRLTGMGSVTLLDDPLPDRHYTSIAASSGGVGETPNGQCCMMFGDTTLSLFFPDRPAVGRRILQPPNVYFPEHPAGVLFHTGADDLLLIVRESFRRARLYFPVRPATLDLVEVVQPTEGQDGRVRGRVTFEAGAIVEETDASGQYHYSRFEERTTRIYAEFVTPMKFRVFTPPIPPPTSHRQTARR